MSMAYIREFYGVPAKRGMAVRPKVGPNRGRSGVIRRAKDGLLVVTDKPGRYGWWSILHPLDVDYLPQQGGRTDG